MAARTTALVALLAAACLSACDAAGSPAAAFDGVRNAARERDLAALHECLAPAERARMDRELPGWNAERGEGPALVLAAYGRDLDLLAVRQCVGFERDGDRAVLRLVPPGGRDSLPMLRDGGHWRVADLGAILGLSAERLAEVTALKHAGDALRDLRDRRALPDATGAEYAGALGLPVGENAPAWRGPTRAALARTAAGETGLPVVAGDPSPDGLCLLWADGTAEFLPWRALPGAPEGPVPVGPDSPIPLLRGLVYTE